PGPPGFESHQNILDLRCWRLQGKPCPDPLPSPFSLPSLLRGQTWGMAAHALCCWGAGTSPSSCRTGQSGVHGARTEKTAGPRGWAAPEGEKPHACPDCGRCFRHGSHLTTHRRLHTGEKPHACPDCGRQFCHGLSLSTHRHLHRGEKPHTCPDCGRCFRQSSHLIAHRRRHMGERPYSCPHCGRCFAGHSGPGPSPLPTPASSSCPVPASARRGVEGKRKPGGGSGEQDIY
uniref:C2H2-type domain-containing protein n=1 Tax=Crocodylus porosus TaxID=8502 RepID=A0A7M4FD22_CROPO